MPVAYSVHYSTKICTKCFKKSYQSTKNSAYPWFGFCRRGSPISAFTPTNMSVLDLTKQKNHRQLANYINNQLEFIHQLISCFKRCTVLSKGTQAWQRCLNLAKFWCLKVIWSFSFSQYTLLGCQKLETEEHPSDVNIWGIFTCEMRERQLL